MSTTRSLSEAIIRALSGKCGDRDQGQVLALRRVTLIRFACPAGLPLLAYASAPDVVWVPSIYDLAEHVDVINVRADVETVEESPAESLVAVSLVSKDSGHSSVLSNSSLVCSGPRAPPSSTP